MRWHQIYGYGLLADCVTVATDVECHCGRRKREETGGRERTVTQGILEEIHSICTYLSGWIPQRRMLKFTSRITNRASNMARCNPLPFFKWHSTSSVVYDSLFSIFLCKYLCSNLIARLCLDLNSHKAGSTPLSIILNLITWKQYSYSNNMHGWGSGGLAYPSSASFHKALINANKGSLSSRCHQSVDKLQMWKVSGSWDTKVSNQKVLWQTVSEDLSLLIKIFFPKKYIVHL